MHVIPIHRISAGFTLFKCLLYFVFLPIQKQMTDQMEVVKEVETRTTGAVAVSNQEEEKALHVCVVYECARLKVHVPSRVSKASPYSVCH